MLHVTTTDADLLKRVRDWRENESWRHFYERYAPAIAAHARRSGLTHEEAEDVVQATMIKVATYIPQFEYDRTVCKFRTWLNQIVNQRILAIWHERRKLRLPEEAWVYLSELIGGKVNQSEDPLTQSEMEHRMIQVCLARARQALKPRHWQLFEAHALGGMTAAEVAKVHQTTTANVWVVRHRVTQRLKAEWKSLQNEPF